MRRIIIFIFQLFACIVAAISAGDGINNSIAMQYDEIVYYSDSKLGLHSKQIFFGHQSVGDNIVKGLCNLQMSNKSFKLKIIEGDYIDPAADNVGGVLFHAKIGHNKDPKSKLLEFREILKKDHAGILDIAFMKFCYLDIQANTDIKELFAYYSSFFSKLEKEHPNIQFLHFTVPLITKPTGIKSKIKSMIGMAVYGIDDNIKRNEFNELMRNKYGAKVFDIAALESTYPDGKRSTFNKYKKTYYALASEYATDRGHLNAKFGKSIASKLLYFLSSVDNH